MIQKIIKRTGVVLALSAVLASSFDSAYAASSAVANNTDVSDGLKADDIIDTSRLGSLSIYKYDTTAASQAGVYQEGDITATGKPDEKLQETIYDYAIEGVEFSYLRVGGIEQYSKTSGTNSELKNVYEIPTDLAAILGLGREEAVDMTADGVSATCKKVGVFHYTSQQINDALAAILAADDVAAKDALETYIQGNTKAKAMKLTDEEGYTSVDGLALGLYLIVETEVPENVTETTNPWFVSVPMTNLTADGGHEYDETNKGGEYWFYDITCYPKNQTGNPTLDKMVRNATGKAASSAGISEDHSYLVFNQDDFSSYGYGNADKNTSAQAYAAARGDALYATTTGGIAAGANEADGNGGVADHSSSNGKNDGLKEAGASDVTVRENVTGEYQYASTTTASEGDVLDFILVSKLPHISSKATFLSQYTFQDILSEGMSYNQDARIAFYTSAADAYINNTAKAVDIWSLTYNTDGTMSDSNHYAQAYTDVYTSDGKRTNKTSLTVSMTEKGLARINGNNGDKDVTTGYSDYYMVVYYTATVHSNETVTLGDNGNPNDVTLTWERTSFGYTDTLEDKCYVYTYGIDLTKTFSDEKGDAAKVKFKLYNQTDGYYVDAMLAEEGLYYVTGKTAKEKDAVTFSPSREGKMLIYGLEGDSYALIETATDNGYSLLKEPVVINIRTASRSIQAAVAGWTGLTGYNKGQQNGKIHMFESSVKSGTAAVDDITATMLADKGSGNAIVRMALMNNSSFTLPQTGGAGLYAITILGVFVVAAGCYFIVKRKKK